MTPRYGIAIARATTTAIAIAAKITMAAVSSSIALRWRLRVGSLAMSNPTVHQAGLTGCAAARRSATLCPTAARARDTGAPPAAATHQDHRHGRCRDRRSRTTRTGSAPTPGAAPRAGHPNELQPSHSITSQYFGPFTQLHAGRSCINLKTSTARGAIVVVFAGERLIGVRLVDMSFAPEIAPADAVTAKIGPTDWLDLLDVQAVTLQCPADEGTAREF